MKKFYKTITLILMFVVCFSMFVACGDDQGDGHSHKYENGVCIVCGAPQAGSQENNLYTIDPQNENIIYFGSYPQSKVSDSETLQTLNSSVNNPKKDTSGWTNYDYYVNGKKSNCMYFQDVTIDAQKYRGVYIKFYRPRYTTYASDDAFQDNNGYEKGQVYWFKYEQIQWSIVKKEGGKATIVCNMIIDSQQFDFEQYERAESNYKESTIRKWLNREFFNKAFNSLQRQLIEMTEVDNSAESTGYNPNEYACENTADTIYLLSQKELDTYFPTNESAKRKNTDYAKSQGCSTGTGAEIAGNGYWWLRSPRGSAAGDAMGVNYYGGSDFIGVNATSYGVVPALTIKL